MAREAKCEQPRYKITMAIFGKGHQLASRKEVTVSVNIDESTGYGQQGRSRYEKSFEILVQCTMNR